MAKKNRSGTPTRAKLPIFIDRGIPSEIAGALGKSYVRVAGLAGQNMSDRDVWREAVDTDAVLITHDSGFWNDSAFLLHESPGVIIVKGHTASEIDDALGRFTRHFELSDAERFPALLMRIKFKLSGIGYVMKTLTIDSKKLTATVEHAEGDAHPIFENAFEVD